MKLRLNSIEQAPLRLPAWQLVLEDLGCPPAPRVARVLGISKRSVYRFNRDGHAWLTRCGRASVDAQATNDAIQACGYVEALRQRIQRLEGRVALLLALSNSGAANDAFTRF